MAEAEAGVVSDIWRFPVKSFGGERLRRAFLGPFGLLGDRRHALVAPDGVPLTARRTPRLLAFSARYPDPGGGEAEVVTPSGVRMPAGDPALPALVAAEIGREPEAPPLAVLRSPAGFHDAAPVHVVTEPSLAQVGAWVGDELDRRRFRANLVVDPGHAEPFPEAGWPGRALVVGEAVLEVVVPTERCAVTTWDPDTLERDTRVLAGIARNRDNFFGVYARVQRPGWVAVGDRVRLVPAGAPVS